MNILIVYPRFNNSGNRIADFFRRRADQTKFPPRECLVASTLLPITWQRRVIDLNQRKLKRQLLNWADYIFITAKEDQYNSVTKVIGKSKAIGKKIVAIGSLFTEFYDEFEHVDHLVLDDYNITLPQLISDLENKIPKCIYQSNASFERKRKSEGYYSLKSLPGNLLQHIQISYV